ncbi:MAG: CHAT domain-containing protein [Bacteroidota bacterium]
MTPSPPIRPMSSIALLLMGSLWLSTLHAQAPSDSLGAAQLLAQAKAFLEQGDYANAQKQALVAAEAFANIEDWDNWLQSYRVILNMGYFKGDYDSVIPLLESAKQSLPPTQALIKAKLLFYLGYAYDNIGQVSPSLRAYETGAPIFQAARDTSWLISLYGNLIASYTQLGDYARAIDYAQTAELWSRHSTDTLVRWRNLRMLGRAYFFKYELDKAQRSYQQAQQLYDPGDGIFEYYQAEIALSQGQLQKARRLIRRAIDKVDQKAPERQRFQRLWGEIELAAGRYASAMQQFLDILPSYQSGPNQRQLGQLYIRIAEASQGLRQYDQALSYYQQASQTFVPEFTAADFTQNPPPQWTREVWMIEVLKGKGDCFLAKYKEEEEEQWLRLAEQHHQLAIDYIEELKLGFKETSSQLWFSNNTHDFYEQLLVSKFQRYLRTQTRADFDAAFRVAQRANAFVLRALLTEQQALQVAGVAADTVELLRAYGTELAVMNSRLEEPQAGRSDTLVRRFLETKLKRQQLKEQIAERYPRFAQLRNDLQTTSVAELQQRLEKDQLLLKYFLGEQVLYVFSISQQDFGVDSLALPVDFVGLLGQYRRSLSDLDFVKDSLAQAERQFLSSAHRLYQLLLQKPLRRYKQQGIKRLTIVADGLLNSIPFQALMPGKGGSWTRAEDFLIARYAVNYAYFCKMLLGNPAGGTGKGDFVAFGLEFDDYTLQYLQRLSKDSIKNQVIQERLRSGKLTPLPFSDDEARELAQLMRGRAWLNEEATKANFLQHTKEARAIHMATHSILDTEAPNRSALVFIKTRDSLNNLLRQDEIYNLRFRADLIVLSACNSGAGLLQRGEGINSLARAFNFSGIPAVTATLWSITDESSKKLMGPYYRFLQAGWPKDLAMQKAQLAYLQSDELSSPAFRLPVYWAAWMPIGDTSAIASGPSNWLIKLGLVLLLLGGVVWIIRRRSAA